MREVYLDNAATTKVRPEIAEAMAKAMVEIMETLPVYIRQHSMRQQLLPLPVSRLRI